MRKILFLVLFCILFFSFERSARADGISHNTTMGPSDGLSGTKNRETTAGLSEKNLAILGDVLSKDNLDEAELKNKIEELQLSLDEIEALKENLTKRRKETSEDDQQKRYDMVLALLKKPEEEEKPRAETAPKPSSKPLQTTGSQVIAAGGKKLDVYKLPNGFEVHLDPQGRKTVDGQPLVVVGKEGAAMMDGLFPASAIGLQVGDKGAISIDPKPSMLTVSRNNGPQINSAVPVIFSNGQALARQGVIDDKGNQTLYWTNASGDFFSSVGKGGGDIVTVSRDKLPIGLESRRTGDTTYLTVSARTPERGPDFEAAKNNDGSYNIGMAWNAQRIVSTKPKAEPPHVDSQTQLTTTMDQYSTNRDWLVQKSAPNSPQQALVTSADPSCAGGLCGTPAARPASRPGQCHKGMPCYRGQ
jgi:hypothetical protein